MTLSFCYVCEFCIALVFLSEHAVGTQEIFANLIFFFFRGVGGESEGEREF